MKKVIIYTDGGCKPNPGKGGWAYLLLYGEHRKSESGNNPWTTNNRMELTAALEALKALKQPCEVQLHSDSSYLVKGMKGWIHAWERNGYRTSNGEVVKNADLWSALYAMSFKHNITWVWVKGHATNPHNNHVDKLASEAIRRLRS